MGRRRGVRRTARRTSPGGGKLPLSVSMEGRRIENTLVALRRHLSGAVWITQKSASGDAREHVDGESICSGLGSGRVPMDRARRRLHRLPPRGPPAPPGSASGLVCEGPSRGSSSPPPTTIFSPRTAPGSRCRPIECDERKPWPQSGPQTAKGSPRTGLGKVGAAQSSPLVTYRSTRVNSRCSERKPGPYVGKLTLVDGYVANAT